MRIAYIHGQNKGDTVYALQGCYAYPSVTYVTDEWNRSLIEFIISSTDVPVSTGIFLPTINSTAIDKCKFSEERCYDEAQWRSRIGHFDKYVLCHKMISRDKHISLALNNSRTPRVIQTRGITPKKSLSIVVAAETWNPARQYLHWRDLNLNGSVELTTGMYSRNTLQEVVVVDNGDIATTVEIILGANLVVGVASFTAALSASLGVPTIMFHATQTSLKTCGVSIFGGTDFLVSEHPRAVQQEIERRLGV